MMYFSRIHMFRLLVSLVSIHFSFDVDHSFLPVEAATELFAIYYPSSFKEFSASTCLEVLLLPLKLLCKPFHSHTML